MNKLILFIIIIAAVLFGGKLGLEYYYAKKLDEFVNNARFVADIDYQNVRIGTDGSISINNLSIEPHALDTLVRIKSITLFSSDKLLPLNLATFIKRTEFPDELGVRIANMEYYPSVFAATIEQADKCRYIETTISPQVTGINRLNTNIEASIQVNSNNAVMRLSSSDQTAELNLQASFDASMLKPTRSSSNAQPFDEITAKYKLDEQLASFLVQTCAEQLAMSTDEYLNNVVASPNYLRSIGADFGPEASQAVVDVMQGGKWLSIHSKPSSQLKDFNSLSFYQTKDIVNLLGLEVSIDSKDVALVLSDLPLNNPSDDADENDIKASLAAQITSSQIEVISELSAVDQARIKVKLKEEARTNPDIYSYQTTPIGNLSRYLNHSVILIRSGDLKQLTGELIAINSPKQKQSTNQLGSINDDVFIIETTQYGGKAQFEIPLNDVVEVQVYK